MTAPFRRVGVIGDAHCEDARLATAIDLFRSRAVDAICCVGDVVDGSGDPNRTCQLLRDAEAIVVAGNHERWFIAGSARDLPEATHARDVLETHRTWLAQLPREIELATVAGSALLCHGLGPNDMAAVRPDDHGYGLSVNDDLWRLVATRRYSFVINGHTHERMVRRFEDTVVINAGTLRKDRGGAVLVDFGVAQVSFFGFVEGGRLDPIEEVGIAPHDLSRETRGVG